VTPCILVDSRGKNFDSLFYDFDYCCSLGSGALCSGRTLLSSYWLTASLSL
jgi:hypothetical protein